MDGQEDSQRKKPDGNRYPKRGAVIKGIVKDWTGGAAKKSPPTTTTRPGGGGGGGDDDDDAAGVNGGGGDAGCSYAGGYGSY